MKTAWITLLVLFALANGVGFLAVKAADFQEPSEFFFTRLVYSQNTGGRGFRFPGLGSATMPKPRVQYRCPEFGGRNFFPPQGWGWATDYPGADCKFMGGINRLTGLNVHPNPNVIGIMDEELFQFPYVYAVEVGQMYLSEEEGARLREYLLRGGFLHVDDYWGLREKSTFEEQFRKVFPERPFVPLPPDHEVYKTFFDITENMQIPGQGDACFGGETWQEPDDTEPRVLGISDDSGRLMVLATYNSDLGDAWEYMDLACYPQKYSGQAYRLGMNFMIYAFTH